MKNVTDSSTGCPPLYIFDKGYEIKKIPNFKCHKNHGQMSIEINLELHNFYPLKQYG